MPQYSQYYLMSEGVWSGIQLFFRRFRFNFKMPSGLTFRRPKGIPQDVFNLIREQRAPRRIMSGIVANTRRRSTSRRAFTRSRRGGLRRAGLGANTTHVFATSKVTKHNLIKRFVTQAADIAIPEVRNDKTIKRFGANFHHKPLVTNGPSFNLPNAEGYTLMQTLYDHYFCLGSNIVVTCQNTTNIPVTIGVNLTDSSNFLGSFREYEYQKLGKTMLLGAGGHAHGSPASGFLAPGQVKTMTFAYSPRQFFKVTNVRNESKLRGQYTGDNPPSEHAYYQVWVASADPDTGAVHGAVFWTIRITYTMLNVEPKTLEAEALTAPP